MQVSLRLLFRPHIPKTSFLLCLTNRNYLFIATAWVQRPRQLNDLNDIFFVEHAALPIFCCYDSDMSRRLMCGRNFILKDTSGTRQQILAMISNKYLKHRIDMGKLNK